MDEIRINHQTITAYPVQTTTMSGPVIDVEDYFDAETLVKVDISSEGRDQLKSKKNAITLVDSNQEDTGTETTGELSDEQQKQLIQLKNTDRAVRAHEQAHVSAGGNLVTKGASYGYQRGPDGVRYAVSGEVQIDTSPVEDDPQATMEKAMQVQRAALAPMDPSPQDYSVAARAAQMAMEARIELARMRYQEQEPKSTSGVLLPGTVN